MPVSILIPGREDRLPRYAAAVRRQGGCPRFGSTGRDCAGLLLPGGGDLNPGLYGEPNRGSRPGDLRQDLLEIGLVREFLAPHLNTLYVTSKDIDASVNRLSKTISDAINLALKE